MSDDFLWELEKLRRRFGVGSKEIAAANQALDRKRRGPKPQNDGEHLAKIQAGVSVEEVAKNVGGLGADAAQIRLSRKDRKIRLQSQYWGMIEEISILLSELSPAHRATYMERLATTGPPKAPHLIVLDIADCCIKRVSESGRLSAGDRDHLGRAALHHRMIKNIDLDSPLRRKGLAGRIDILGKVLQDLRRFK
jgi:hypothetical protein